jgi:ATP-dependent RNA helicase CshB
MYDTSNESIVHALEKKGITFEMKELKGNQFIDSKDREKRKSRVKHQTDLEKKISLLLPGAWKSRRRWQKA